jgi:hypothetical protein
LPNRCNDFGWLARKRGGTTFTRPLSASRAGRLSRLVRTKFAKGIFEKYLFPLGIQHFKITAQLKKFVIVSRGKHFL